MYYMIVLYIHQVHLGLYCHISNKRRALTISHLECQLVYIHAPVMAAPVLSQTLCYKRKFNTVYEGDSWEQITLHKAQLQGLFFIICCGLTSKEHTKSVKKTGLYTS